MSISRPARCLFCSLSRIAAPRIIISRRQFQVSAGHASRKPKTAADGAGPELKTLEQLSREMKPEDFAAYTEEQAQELAKQYTPEQVAAIEAGEGAIDAADLADQFAIRRDPMKLHYLDDFSVIEPVVDKHVRHPQSNTDYKARLKTEDEFIDDLARFTLDLPDDATGVDWVRFVENTRVTTGSEDSELRPHSSLVPPLFQRGESLSRDRRPATAAAAAAAAAAARRDPRSQTDGEEVSSALKALLHATGYKADEVRALKTKTLVSHSVVNQTRLGKIRRQYCLSIAGNGNGLLGIGEAKSEEGSDAALQSRYRAIRNMQPIARFENRTIFGDVCGKVGAVELKLMNRPPGFGLRCQYLIYEMCRAAGLHDLAARVGRSRNPMNTVKAAYEALRSQRNPEEIARARGKKLVDVRKVYYAGRV